MSIDSRIILLNDARREHVRKMVHLLDKYVDSDPELIRHFCRVVDLENDMIELERENHNKYGAPGEEWGKP